MAPPGMLYVTMQLGEGQSLDQFHDWYNNEHGPLRLRKPDIFSNGLRYIATDDTEPTYLAMYDVTDMDKLATPAYTTLRANRSPREAEVIGQIRVVRQFLELGSERKTADFVPPEQLSDADAQGRVLVSVEVFLSDAEGAEAEVTKWYEEEHIEMLSKVPGWLRTRRYSVSPLDGDGNLPRKIVTLHEYAKENGLGGPEHKASMATPWRDDIFSKYIITKGRRTYSLFYVFGPAPRELSALSKLPPTEPVAIPGDHPTTTISGPSPSITSFITTSDGLTIPYRLEGNPSPTAPTVAFVNSLLTSLHMWDPFVAILLKHRPDLRILRYDSRGRNAISSPATMDGLADDLAALLAALRVDKLHALIGVSVGGATTLNFALRYPDKLRRFVACDFNVAGSEANTKAWKERTALAETEGMRKLGGMTVERWFHPRSMSNSKVVEWMVDMVAANDLEGFRYGCQALWEYDFKPEMKECQVPGLLVVGEGDGKGALVKAMEGFKGAVGEKGVDLKIVLDTGHLPMCEDPEAFWAAVKDFI